MADPIALLVAQLRTANVASKRVRAGEAAGQTQDYEGDALPKGRYKRFVVLSSLSRTLLARGAVQHSMIGVRSYGATFQDAAALANDVSDALHLAGGRGSGGSWIYQSIEESGGAANKDPDTGQPYESGVISLIATA